MKSGCGYSEEPHGEVIYEEWYECDFCHWRWSVDRPEDRCDCEDRMEDEESRDPYEGVYE